MLPFPVREHPDRLEPTGSMPIALEDCELVSRNSFPLAVGQVTGSLSRKGSTC